MDNLAAKRLNRINKSKLNTTIALTTSVLMGVLSFAERTVFNHCFIADYLGLYSFYYNILGILSTIELGVASAIAFALYEPIEHQKYDQIAAIMRLFRRTYRTIGTIILVAGFFLFPVLEHLIITDIPISNVRLYFSFFLIKTVFNYYFGYRAILITANQNQYKTSIITNFSWSFLYIAEMVISVTTHNFLIYCIAILCFEIIRSMAMHIVGGHEFPEIRKYKKAKLSAENTKIIIKNIKGLIITRISSVLVTSTDSLLISAMVGTAFLGKYSNYQMITTGLMTITALVPQSITASVGNAGVTETKRTMSKSFEILNMASFFVYGPMIIVLINIINPIISTFFGADRVIDIFSVALVCTSFYLSNQREIILTFKSSLGLYWEDRKRPVVEGLTNLIVSIILGKFWGFDGIIIGTIVSQVFVNLTIEPRVIYHEGLHSSAFWYYIVTSGRCLLTIFLSLICFIINSHIELSGIPQIIVYTLVSILITVPAFLLLYHRNEDARTIFRPMRIAFQKRKNKTKSD